MAKKMVINCANCDARKVTEETLAAYESIMINAATIVVSPDTKELLNRYGVTMNCANVMELDADVELGTVNGTASISSSDLVVGRKYLSVNGKLEIGPDTQKVLAAYVGIMVNGSVTYPESVSAHLGKLKVNGITVCYPDDAIVLKRNAVIDKLFALRAKPNLYWSAKRMIMVDPLLDVQKLEQKGARFSSGEVIIAESKVEAMIGLIDEKAEIVIVPDGTSVIMDDVELDDMTLKKYGTKLYIIGDLEIGAESAGALEQLTYFNVRGDAKVPAELKGRLMEALTEISGDVQVARQFKGRRIEDKKSVRISRWMLEQEPDGISVSDCMTVNIDEDIPKELILQKLSIRDVMTVKCAPDQEDVLAAVCEDVLKIGEGGGEETGIGSMVKEALGGIGDLLNTKMVNASDYVM